MVDWVTITWATVSPVLVAFALIAVVISYRMKKDQEETVDNFITARNKIGTLTIAWSFYAGALGSWVITGPANYASFAGLLGLTVYSISSGFPILIIAFLGKVVRQRVPSASSAADFVLWRFGPLAQLYVVLLILFNMSIAMLSEYTTMSSLFRDFVNTEDIPIILMIALLTLAYTIYGGLLVSLVTDQFQGAASVIFSVAIAVYVGSTFDQTLKTPLTKEQKGFTESGYSSILVMPVSLLAATMFSDAMWQRCWASATDRTLYKGAIMGCFAVIAVVFGFGFLGFLAIWGGLVDFEKTNPNLYLFQVFKKSVGNGTARLDNWVGLVTIVAAATMSQASVDSLQNGLMATVSSYLLKNQPLFMTRILVFVVNVPLIVIGLRRYNVLNLFLVANMLCSTSFIPMGLGFIDALHKWYTGDMMFFSCIGSIVFTSGYGVYQKWDKKDVSKSFTTGIRYTWYENGYDWKYFLAAILSSVGSVIVCMAIGWPFIRYNIRGISPTRWVEAIQAHIRGIWESPSKYTTKKDTAYPEGFVPGRLESGPAAAAQELPKQANKPYNKNVYAV